MANENESVQNITVVPNSRFLYFIRGLGPGILTAAAAIGASHLVASTKAGALFGWQLAWVLLVVNLLKYPFIVAGTRYTMSTGKSLIAGYKDKGVGYLVLFGILNAIAAVTSVAGVSMLTGAILRFYIDIDIDYLVGIVLFVTLIIIVFGHYVLMDKLTKVVMICLTITTIIATLLAFKLPSVMLPNFQEPDPYSVVYIGFMIATMGWMPAPIEISTWNSLWILEKKKRESLTKEQALFDFNLGYVVTAILAVVFLALGTLTMYGSGVSYPESGIGFAKMLLGMYGKSFGHGGAALIGLVAFLCIFTTTITVVDGYSRSLDETWIQLTSAKKSEKRFNNVAYVISLLGLIVVWWFKSNLASMLGFAMSLAFVTTIIFAWINYALMTSSHLPVEDRYGPKMKALSWAGFIYLILFLGLFAYWFFKIKA